MTTQPAPTQPVKVLHLLGRLSRGGGVQVVVRRLDAHIDCDVVSLHVLTARPRIDADGLDELNATIHPLGYAGSKYGPLDRLRLARGVARTMRTVRPDVVQVHSGMAWLGYVVPLVSRRAHIVLEVHDAPGSGRHGRATDLVEGRWARMIKATIVCHSTSVRDEVLKRWPVSSERVEMFPLSIDEKVYYPEPAARAAARAEFGIADHEFVMCVIGRLAPSKRFDRAIELAGRLQPKSLDPSQAGVVADSPVDGEPSATVAANYSTEGEPVKRQPQVPCRLLIVGDGPERERLHELAAASPAAERIHFLGPRFLADVRHALAGSDVLLSTSEYEGFGLTLVEAMACGVPVVAMAVGGVTDIVEDGVTGFLVPDGDLEAMLNAITRLTGNPTNKTGTPPPPPTKPAEPTNKTGAPPPPTKPAEPNLAESMSAAGIARVAERFTGAAMAQAFTNVYQRLATGKK